jgi:DNA primase
MPGMLERTIVDRVQQANDIVDVVSEHIRLTKKGTQMVGLCPFHDDHRPSLYISISKQIFKCFACGAGGDVFKFIQMRENLTFPQAIERLAQRAGIALPRPARREKAEDQKSIDPNKLAKVNGWAAKYFAANLSDEGKGKFVRQYLLKRKISAEDVKKWQLGLAVDSQDDLLKSAKDKGISVKLLEEAGLVVARGSCDKFVNRLMFPITDATGRVIGFGGRTLDEKGAKYINSPATVLFDKGNSLYGLQQARHEIVSTETAVVVEGYTDCIMAHNKGCDNVVAALGTSFTSGQGRLLKRYAKKVVLIFDSDTAGIEAANRALEVCLAQRIDIKLASVPEGKDPCEFLLTAGRKRFEELVNGATDVFKFKWDRLTERFGSDDTLAGKRAAVEEFLQTIAIGLHSGNLAAIDRGLIVNRLSGIMGLDSKEINAELRKRVATAVRTASYRAQNHKACVNLGKGLFATAQREVLEVLLNEPKLFGVVKQYVTADDFDVPILKQMATILFESFESRSQPSLAGVLAGTESVEIAGYFVQLAQGGEEKGNFEARLTGALQVIQRMQDQKKGSEIKPVEEPAKFLRHVHESASREDRHNIGMV